jgi:hypothetical protein
MQWISALGGTASAIHADAHVAREANETKRAEDVASFQQAEAS